MQSRVEVTDRPLQGCDDTIRRISERGTHNWIEYRLPGGERKRHREQPSLWDYSHVFRNSDAAVRWHLRVAALAKKI